MGGALAGEVNLCNAASDAILLSRFPEERQRRDVGTQHKVIKFLKFSHSLFFKISLRFALSFALNETGSPHPPTGGLGMTDVSGGISPDVDMPA